MNKFDILAKLKNKKIGVLYGGFSNERDVSIVSGSAVLNVFKKLKVNVCGLDVDKDIAEKIKKERIDIAYLALHGRFGEDGTIQGMLEILGVPYTGCGVFASAISMDKDISKKLFMYEDIFTPQWEILKKNKPLPKVVKYPVVVKPVSQGSTIGVTIVKKASQFVEAVKKAFNYDKEIMLEQFLRGKEITVSVLYGKALPIIEIVPKGEFYDFKSKYQKGCSKHIIPACMSDEAYRMAENFAEKIYKVFKCRAMCRVDMIVDDCNKVWVLENNTLPGMTSTSLFPDAAKAIGYDFESLILKILESAL
jgi:D-alanine-D-alanine ligase